MERLRWRCAVNKHAVAAILLLLSIAAPVAVVAGPLEDGNAVYKRGDYIIFGLWRWVRAGFKPSS
jgi:hypothetical protein